ncbi:hypothetical protein ACFYPC_25265 [Streptomyces sp. NPDC005808]|uniref:hypothetical protein n=1 Tax=Streptomyces sp. NPDC005808 TaxID=3364734 RepID=UPI00367DF3A4
MTADHINTAAQAAKWSGTAGLAPSTAVTAVTAVAAVAAVAAATAPLRRASNINAEALLYRNGDAPAWAVWELS